MPSLLENTMDRFGKQIRPFVTNELLHARNSRAQGDGLAAFRYLERAHVLGQASIIQHVRVHGHMLAWALRHLRLREVLGQVLRLAGAATKTPFWIPVGNTGGTNVNPFKPMPIPDDLQRTIDLARARSQP